MLKTPSLSTQPILGSRSVALLGAWAGVMAVSLGLRLGGLAWIQPLAPLEASQSWAAWLAGMGQSAGDLACPTAGACAASPLLFTVQRFLFWMTGGGEGMARAFPALVGGLLPLVAWRARPRLGEAVAWSLALLLAMDPWLVALSRRADGAILALTFGLALLVELDRRGSGQGTTWVWPGGLAGLFLLSGPLTWLMLPVLALAGWSRAVEWPLPEDGRAWRQAGIGFALALVVGGTGLFAHWAGLGVAAAGADLAWTMLTGQGVERLGGPYPLTWIGLRAVVDALPVLVLGLPPLILAVVRARRGDTTAATPERAWTVLLVGWLLWGVVLWLLPGRNPLVLPMVGMPLLLAAAWGLPRLVGFVFAPAETPDRWLILGVYTVLLVTARFWTANLVAPPANPSSNLEVALLFYALLPLLAGFFLWWSGVRPTLQGLAGAGLLFLAVWLLSATWSLNLRTDWFAATALFGAETAPEVRLLREDVTRLSAYRTGDPGQIPVRVRVAAPLRPLLGWHLREMRNLRFVTGVDPEVVAEFGALVIAMPDAPLALPGGYVGNAYPVVVRWLPTDLPDIRSRLRWILSRRVDIPPAAEQVVLWASENG